MQLTLDVRKKLKKAKTLTIPQTIAFEAGKVYVVGSESAVRVDVVADLFGGLTVDGFLCYEGESVSSIINLIAEGNEFIFQNNDLEISSEGARSVYRSTSSPTYKVPDALRSYDDLTPSVIYIIDNVKDVAKAIEFVSLATMSKKGGVFSDRIFISDRKGTLLIYGTNNAILNMSKCGPSKVNTTNGKSDIILPGKTTAKVAKLLKEEQLECHLTKFPECAILYLKELGLYIQLPDVMGEAPNTQELMKQVAACDQELLVESAEALTPPKELLSIGDSATIEISSGSNVRILIDHPGGRNSFDTEIRVDPSVPATNIVVKKDDFFPCISTFDRVFYIRWIGSEPAFVAISDKLNLSVHATVLGN